MKTARSSHAQNLPSIEVTQKDLKEFGLRSLDDLSGVEVKERVLLPKEQKWLDGFINKEKHDE